MSTVEAARQRILHHLYDGRRAPVDPAEVVEQVVLCGHSHLPHTLLTPRGRLVVNPGSVGLPAYRDDSPRPHSMEAGSPHARYAIVELTAAGRRVDEIAVPYDWKAAARTAAANGRPDWAGWLRTGTAAR